MTFRDLHPSFAEFKHKAAQGNLIPVYREILADTETPVSAFMKLKQSRHCFLLESVEGGEKWARYSFIGFDPSTIFTCRGSRVTIRSGRSRRTRTTDNPLDLLKAEMRRYRAVPDEGLPAFFGGAIGYISYDMARCFEQLPEAAEDDLRWNDACFMITDTLIIFDNVRHNVKVVCNVHTDAGSRALSKAYADASRRIDGIIAALNRPLKRRTPARLPGRRALSVTSNIEPADFKKAVSRAKRYIRSGECIQVVLSQRFETPLRTDPFELYRSLRVVNPSPYLYYLKMDDACIVGSSPEVLVRMEGGEAVVRPIAGTRPRGATPAQDRACEQELINDPKEIAEHIMLVDLGRNDVGRVSVEGSVRVDDFMHIERYSHVMHIVSNVTGSIKKTCDAFDVLRATFPAGTVSGAPKIRAMEIIDELEKHKRGPYAGAVGYFSFSGSMDFCITIRTMLVKNGRVYIQAGAGIVIDSKPGRELAETVNKARGMLTAIANANRGL